MLCFELQCSECPRRFHSPRRDQKTCSQACRKRRSRRLQKLDRKCDQTDRGETVPVLFTRRRSIYRELPSTDCYDIDRDARTFDGAAPLVTHPPCRAWGVLRHMAKPRDDERSLALFAVQQVRKNGGVLEHPARSSLWPVAQLPEPGERDAWGGFTICVDQFWWGHLAYKPTRLYIVGCQPGDLPPLPFRIDAPTHCISPAHGKRAGDRGHRTGLSKAGREATPKAFAKWLLEVARRCKR